jgi:hypothetical protein
MLNHCRAESQVKGFVLKGQVPAISFDEDQSRMLTLEVRSIL